MDGKGRRHITVYLRLNWPLSKMFALAAPRSWGPGGCATAEGCKVLGLPALPWPCIVVPYRRMFRENGIMDGIMANHVLITGEVHVCRLIRAPQGWC